MLENEKEPASGFSSWAPNLMEKSSEGPFEQISAAVADV